MKVVLTDIPDVLILEPTVYEDPRGFFYESFNQRTFKQHTGLDPVFVQDNHSRSAQHVLRGLHYQVKQPQGKLVRVVVGEVFDVAVDLRRGSPTLGRWTGAALSAANRRQIWIPIGFAHGFLVLSEFAECLYKTTDYWSPQDERCLRWNDAEVAIAWPLTGPPVLSPKDGAGVPLKECELFS